MIKQTCLFVLCGVLFCSHATSRQANAYECGKVESAALKEFIERIMAESANLEKCIKSSKSSEGRVKSCKLLQATLHSLFIAAASMHSMVRIGCNVVKYEKLNKLLLVKAFEEFDRMISGLCYIIADLASSFETEGQYDLVKVSHSIGRQANDVAMMCMKFYGTIFERMGEVPPPSP